MNHIEIQFHFSTEKLELMKKIVGFYPLFASYGMQSLGSHQTTIELHNFFFTLSVCCHHSKPGFKFFGSLLLVKTLLLRRK